MTNLLDFTLPELTDWMRAELGEPDFRAVQVWQWLWQKLARDFDSMSNVSKACRARLAERARIVWPDVALVRESGDGTTKFLLRLDDGALVESVLIPSDSRSGARRWTLCLSCQVGCAMSCSFCATGQTGFERNMSLGEILGQVLTARAYLGDSRPDRPMLRNLVFMGMGEPLLNLSEVLRALRCLNDDRGLNFSPRRITVSTCGLEKGLEELGTSGLCYLAVSLHAPNQALRAELMPRAARWPLPDLVRALKAYPLKTRERITLEYLLIAGVNDGLEQAGELARLVNEVRGKLNLIVYNPVENLPYASPDPERVLAFERFLWKRHITAVVRKSKGLDISAACGQLRARHL
ncbi:MAG: 23S rRNA (adenine(2503)-C(2))-methyltransferase RlmN [Desulfovibrio sp.]|jgi:23S rRNA (adenine2503-C2)-methyltransferase|nr:23S rRNA (adenine(2503)-C(2))-methyltransferase RlmN [Desulfovibrio sp.]